MTAQPLPFEPDPEARAARRIAMAHRLAEMAMELAEAVQRRALAQVEREIAAAEAGEAAPAEDAPFEKAGSKGRREDPLASVDRVSRMVRLSLALAARLDEGEPVRRDRMRAEALAQREADAEARSRALQAQQEAAGRVLAAREDTVIAAVAQALVAEGEEAGEERLMEIYERLREGEWEYDLTERPNGAVIAQFCADYEIEPDWSVWALEAWAVEEAATNAPGSPYAAGYTPPAAAGDAEAPSCETAEAAGQSP